MMLLTKNQRLAEVRWEKDNLEPLGNELTTRQKKNVIRHVERSGAKQIDALQKELGVTSNASISDAVDPSEDGGQPYEWPSDSNAATSSNQVWSAPSQLPKSLTETHALQAPVQAAPNATWSGGEDGHWYFPSKDESDRGCTGDRRAEGHDARRDAWQTWQSSEWDERSSEWRSSDWQQR